MGRDIFNEIKLPKAPSNLALNPSREGAATASLGNLCQGLAPLTGKNFCLRSDLNLPSFSLDPFPLVRSLPTGDEAPPPFLQPLSVLGGRSKVSPEPSLLQLNPPNSLSLSSYKCSSPQSCPGTSDRLLWPLCVCRRGEAQEPAAISARGGSESSFCCAGCQGVGPSPAADLFLVLAKGILFRLVAGIGLAAFCLSLASCASREAGRACWDGSNLPVQPSQPRARPRGPKFCMSVGSGQGPWGQPWLPGTCGGSLLGTGDPLAALAAALGRDLGSAGSQVPLRLG
ncbi:repressor of RNA polymerase III transcription MAF1 homolog isoform X1 [Strix aluco]|uniref:repressor of RNA polymerase III transcription MAF1 homolog isoform X1 n=1 Tax=Strix aluco TaxID=111821 RepID=UPI003DA47B98